MGASVPRTTDPPDPAHGPDELLRDDGPRWDAVTFEVLCPRCDYNLRLLTQPRCPECGLELEWRKVLDDSARQSRFLFEHHWRRRPFWSYLKTFAAGLRPKKFWQSVSIHDHIHARPLWCLLLTSPVVFALVLWSLASACAGVLEPLVGQPGIAGTSALQEFAMACRSLSDVSGNWEPHVFLPALLFVSLLVALATVCSLRQTLGRCRVRTVQVIRVFGYAAAPMFTALAILVIALVLATVALPLDDIPLALQLPFALGVYALFPLTMACFLMAGLKHYLRLPHPRALAVTATVVGFLFSVTGMLLLSGVR